MHLVLGSQRHDLRDRVVLIALVGRPGPVDGADAVWVRQLDDREVRSLPIPVGADAADADDVHRLADAGVVAVALAPGDRNACLAAIERHLTVLVAPQDLGGVAHLPPGRVLVSQREPAEQAAACWTATAEGPAAWGAATPVLAAGVRVVRTAEPRALRRVATVVERLLRARELAS